MTTNILSICENPMNSITYTTGLDTYGYHVQAAQTVDHAADILATGFQPDIIVVDMSPRIGDVVAFSRFVRQELHYRQTAIVTIGHGRNDEQQAIKASANAFVPRPVHLHTLLDVFQHDL